MGCTTSKVGADRVGFHLDIPSGTSRLTLVGVGHRSTADREFHDAFGRVSHPTSALVECGKGRRDPAKPATRSYTVWISPGPRSEVDDLLKQFDSSDEVTIDALVFFAADTRAFTAAREFAAIPAQGEPRLMAGSKDILDSISGDPLVRDGLAANRIALRPLAPDEKWRIDASMTIRLLATPNACFLEGASRKLLFAFDLSGHPSPIPDDVRDLAPHADLIFVDGASLDIERLSYSIMEKGDLPFRCGFAPKMDLARFRFVSMDGAGVQGSRPGYSNTWTRGFAGDEYLF